MGSHINGINQECFSDQEYKADGDAEEGALQDEIKHLERRYTKQGRVYLAEPKKLGEEEPMADKEPGWHEKFAMTIIHHFDPGNVEVRRTSLQINSPTLKSLLGDVIGTKYPGVSFKTKHITLDFPPRCLFYYHPELRAALPDQRHGSQGESDLLMLLDFIDEHFAEEFKDLHNFLPQDVISFERLWVIFKPSGLVLSSHGGTFRITELDYSEYLDMPKGLQLFTHYTDYDGDSFGTRTLRLFIPHFSGTMPITALAAMPLARHWDFAAVTGPLMERGRCWEALTVGQNLVKYKGLAVDPEGKRYHVEGRVMLDTQTFQRIEVKSSFKLSEEFPKVEPPTSGKGLQNGQQLWGDHATWEVQVSKKVLAPLTITQLLLAPPTVRGFCFTEKKFLEFEVDHTSPISWNPNCFDELVLPTQQKELVQALVTEHASKKSCQFDDIVEGKGKGLIIMLHGPPGVGKTLTAECIAESCCRPLYIVSSAELDTKPTDLNKQLRRILDLASTWKAILLIEEADVFLEQRCLDGPSRNSLVSIFLRSLEYYSGIVFVTANRVCAFDAAFNSRIHLPLKYSPLPAASRLLIWKNLLAKLSDADDEFGDADNELDLDEESLRALADAPINGRQIKNAVQTAKGLANYKGKKLDRKQLEQVVELQMEFMKDLEGLGEKEENVNVNLPDGKYAPLDRQGAEDEDEHEHVEESQWEEHPW